MSFREVLDKKVQETERIIYFFLPKEEGYQKTVMEAMNYSFRAGGKRLRPLLMKEVFVMLGGKSQAIAPFMAAQEMIHTYSLIHDDLPAMDNDMYRRGRKTCHVVYGEDMAILAGDGLLNLAFETACSSFSLEPDNAAIGKALQVLAGKAGIYGMIGGQTADIEAENMKMEQTEERLTFIHANKTAALLQSSMMIGGILANAPEKEVKILEKCAYDIGIAFQIQDDILDVIGNQDVLGKEIGSDEKNRKLTYVSMYGLEGAKKEVVKLSKRAVDSLNGLPGENDFLNKLIMYLINREK